MADDWTCEAFEKRILAVFDDVAERGRVATSYELLVEQQDRLNDEWFGADPSALLPKETFERLQQRHGDVSRLLASRFRQLAATLPPEDHAIVIEQDAPTVENFFYARHHVDAERNAAGAEFEVALATAEARFGIALPEMLKTLYRRQNGGHTDFKLASAVDSPRHEFAGRDKVDEAYDTWETVVPGGTLRPLEQLTTMGEASDATDFGDDDYSWRKLFPHADRMIVLSNQGWDVWLCLDYSRGSGGPSVVLFDEVQWVKLGDAFAYTAPDFDTFFAALRREAVTVRHGRRMRGGRVLAKSE